MASPNVSEIVSTTIEQRSKKLADNVSYKRYSSYEVLDISPQDVITAADYAWKQVAAA